MFFVYCKVPCRYKRLISLLLFADLVISSLEGKMSSPGCSYPLLCYSAALKLVKMGGEPHSLASH